MRAALLLETRLCPSSCGIANACSYRIKLTFQVSDLDVPSDAEIPIEGEVAAEDTDASPYITCSLVITKHAHPDAMSVDLEAGEDGFEVTNVAMFESAVAEAEGAEGDWQRRSKYMGPRECSGVWIWFGI